MKITADTNVLVRSIVADDAAQAEAAQRTLAAAETIALPLPVLCELVWVLRRGYRQPTDDLVRTLRGLIESPECVMDRPAVEAGIALLEAGGDFADGVIAHGGRALGGETFVSFDKQAVLLLQASGVRADIPH